MEKVPNLKVLVQWNLLGNQYQQRSEALNTFMPNKPCAYAQ